MNLRTSCEGVVLTVAFAVLVSACGPEKPSTISREKLAFLEHQQRPLFLEDMGARLGSTPPAYNEPFFSYRIDKTKTVVEFWMYDDRVGESRDEISMVVERPAEGPPRIIWPKELEGTDIRSVMRATWPKMYN